MSCSVGCRQGSDPALLWLWRRLVATAIRSLAWESPYAEGVALEKAKRQKKKKSTRQKSGKNIKFPDKLEGGHGFLGALEGSVVQVVDAIFVNG